MRRIAVLVLLWLAAVPLAAAADPRDVLLVIADDLGADSLALFNDHQEATFPPTPNLDALAARGVRFRRAFAHPACSPTRSSILTGRHPFRTGVGSAILNTPGAVPLSAAELTLPELLSADPTLAVDHASFGKWHLANGFASPNTIGGWSHYAGNLIGSLGDYRNWARTENGATAFTTDYATTRNVDDALAWLAAHPPSRGRFLWVACNAPHSPLHRPPDHLHSHHDLPADGSGPPRRYYEAMIEALDTELGRLFAAVDTNRTTILFIGDNGSPSAVIQPPHPPTRAKGTPYQGGIRVPLIIAGPDVVAPGRFCDTPVHAVDLWATVLELFGSDPALVPPRDRGIDSRSLQPLLRDQPFTPAETCVLTEHFGAGVDPDESARSVQDQDFKLIRFTDGREELYFLPADPGEGTNLLATALAPAAADAHDRLAGKLEEWSEPARPRLRPGTSAAGRFALSYTAYFNHSYALERAPAPSGPWLEPARLLRQQSGAETTLLDLQAPATGAVYRLRVTKP